MIDSHSLDDLRPDVRANCEELLRRCLREGLRVRVTQTRRDDECQALLYAQGRLTAGPIVTNTPYAGFHGAGLAFDICQDVCGHGYDDAAFFERCGQLAGQLGFTWGGDRRQAPDRTHLQWDGRGEYTALMLRAGHCPDAMPPPEAAEDTDSRESRET